MYGATGEKRPIFSESDAFLYNLGDPTYTFERFLRIYDPPCSILLVTMWYTLCTFRYLKFK